MQQSYKRTLFASYTGYITQAIVNNLAPLLFIVFQTQFSISLQEISLLVSFNFCIQMLVDFLSAKFVDRIGYKPCILAAHVFTAAGLIGLGTFPFLFPSPYTGLLACTALYALGGGLIEVLISPIVEALPTKEKSTAMSMLHSFYCWGQVGVVLLSTLYFSTVGIANWRFLPLVWSLVPIFNIYLFAGAPVKPPVESHEAMSWHDLVSTKIFWIFVLLMICAGASELAMSQWASLFAEEGLGVSKTIGDLLGPCLFAVLMGISRTFYGKFGEKIDLKKFMTISGVLCIASYLLAVFAPLPLLSLAGCALCGLAVGILWPGTFSLAAHHCPQGGTAMFAFFALAGDVGCTAGPAVVGTVAAAASGKLQFGLLAAIVFPLILLVGLRALRGIKKSAS